MCSGGKTQGSKKVETPSVISCIQISKPEIIKDEKKNTKNYPSPQNPLCVLKKFNPLKYPRLQINSSQDKTD